VSKVHCTKGELKSHTLSVLKSILHFDDSEDEAIANQELKIPTIRRAKKSGGDKDRDKFFTGDRYHNQSSQKS